MSAISDFRDAWKVHQDRTDEALDGVNVDVQWLKSEVTRLNTVPGTFTAEEQAIVDGILTRVSATADRVAALDSMTPPAVPVG